MSWPFGFTFSSRARRGTGAPIDPQGQRVIGMTLDGQHPIFAPRGHSLLLAAAGGGKTTSGALPWIFSYLSSNPRPAVAVMDSKDGEIVRQVAPMLQKLGIPFGVVDHMHVLPGDFPGRVDLNPFGAAISVFQNASEDLIYALDSITHALIEEPTNDQRNRYFRAWPRLLIEFAIMLMLSRNPKLVVPGGTAALLNDPKMLRKFAAIEADEGNMALQSIAQNILDMAGHEHWPQHLEASQSALRQFRPGTRLHKAGSTGKVTHADLIRQGSIIFLVGPQAYMDQLGPYYALILMGFLHAVYGGAGPLRIIADEFSNAPLKSLVSALTTVRGYGTEVHMIAQARSEIERKFGKLEAETIEEMAITKQWFGFSSMSEAERISKAIGEEHAIATSLGADNESLRLQSNYQLIRQHQMSAAQLLAMPPEQQLIQIKGLGFFMARKLGQQNIAPYCDLIAPNPMEGGKLKPDPKITLVMPKGALL